MRKKATASSADPLPRYMRVATRPTPAASMISIGWKTKRNCGTLKSNSAWKVERPSSRPPGSAMRRAKIAQDFSRSGVPAAALARTPSMSRTDRPTSVIDAPPMSMRCVGPQSVTSWPKRRCQTSSSGKPISENAPQAHDEDAAERRVPVLLDADRGRPDLLLRQHHGEEARGEDAEEAEEDEVVRRVGERALVAAVVDVQRDVPVHAEDRGEQRARGEADGQRGPAGQAGDALGEGGEVGEDVHAAGAVADAEEQQDGGRDDARRRSRGPPRLWRRRRRARSPRRREGMRS